MTMKPMPPSQCRMARHKRMPGGATSRPTITVAPVVVMPDTDFEYGVGQGEVELGERDRQCGEKSDHDPYRGGQEKGLAARQRSIAVALIHQDQSDPGEQCHGAGRQEDLPVGMSGRHVGHHGRGHEQGQDDQQDPDDDQDRPQVDCSLPAEGRGGDGHRRSVF